MVWGCLWRQVTGSVTYPDKAWKHPTLPHISNLNSSFPFGSSWVELLGCTLQAYKPWTHPASRPKKEMGVGNRAISGLMDGGSFTSDTRFWSHTPSCADGLQDKAAVFTPRGWGRLPLIGEFDIRLAHPLPRKPTEALITPFSPMNSWSRHMLGREFTEGKRTANLSGLTIHVSFIIKHWTLIVSKAVSWVLWAILATGQTWKGDFRNLQFIVCQSKLLVTTWDFWLVSELGVGGYSSGT